MSCVRVCGCGRLSVRVCVNLSSWVRYPLCTGSQPGKTRCENSVVPSCRLGES